MSRSSAPAASRLSARAPTPLAVQLPPSPESVALARAHARDIADGLLTGEQPARLQLVISELVGNAVKYGGSDPIRLAMTPKEGFVCVQVTDSGPGLVPRPGAMGDHSPESAGFGLFLVERFARRWGVTREAGRTRVWCELDYEAA